MAKRKSTKCSGFYLEDESGRILVDPQGAKFWDGSWNFLWSPIRSIYLLTDLTEIKAAEVLTRGMKTLWIWMLLWVLLSLVLTLMYWEHLSLGPAWEQALRFIRRLRWV